MRKSLSLSGFYAEMFIGSIDKLNHEMTSYKTRHSSYGNPTGCMKETRVKILEDLENWALNDISSLCDVFQVSFFYISDKAVHED